ncbi:MAG: NAD(P)H-binding protein, partial [Woeseiaceae bacterium]
VRAIAAARERGVRRFIYMSANGVREPCTPYQETKLRAEEYLAGSGLEFTGFRPSVIFGDPRGRMEIASQLHAQMIRPPLPAIGFFAGWQPSRGPVLMSPVHVEDVAGAFVRAIDDTSAAGRRIALGGPETLSWVDMLERIAAATDKRKLILPVPIAAMKLAAALFDWLPFFPATRDQLSMLEQGNVAGPDELAALIGRPPRAFDGDGLAYLRN